MRPHQIRNMEDDLVLAIREIRSSMTEFLGQMTEIPRMGLDLNGPAEAIKEAREILGESLTGSVDQFVISDVSGLGKVHTDTDAVAPIVG